MKKFSSWFTGSQPGKQQRPTQGGRPKKNVHWKSAERPSPPGRPILIPLSDQQPDVVTLKWERPKVDGGSPITGYIIEHRRMGSPHWVRSTPASVVACEVAISGLEPGWRYQFRAIAENIVGRSDPSELSDPLTVTLQRNAISVPRFAKELADLSVVENERVEFRVTILGQPPPEISWFKDGYEIFSSRRTKIVNDNDVSVLIIHQVALTDEGEIKCTATNRAGHVVTKARLMVEAPPKIRLPRNYEDGLIVEADEVLRLKVGIAGQPPPTVVWLHEGEPIPTAGRHELTTSDKNSSLKIDNVKRVDRGEYTIKATNKLGEDTTSFLVTVTSRPNPPGKVRLNTSYGKSATLSWTAPDDDGGCKIGSYIVEYFRIGWNVWLKAATTRQLSTTLNDLIEGSEYKFRVKAENPYGLSDSGEESDVLFVPDPKRSQEETNNVDKPTPPRRKTLSPQRAVDEDRGGTKSPKQLSPMMDRKTKPQILDNEDLHREMSYGTHLTDTRRSPPSTNQIDVKSGASTKRSPSPRNPVVEEKKKVASVSTSTSTSTSTPTPRPVLPPLSLTPKPAASPAASILPIKPVSSPKTPPAIAPALGPVLTSAVAPVLRFAPVTTPTTPTTPPTPVSPQTAATPSRPLSPPKKASPEPKPRPSMIPKATASKNSTPPRKETSPKKAAEPVEPVPVTKELSRNRSLSPVEQSPVRRTPPQTPPEQKKQSKALQRSEEPVETDGNHSLATADQRLTPEQTRRSSQNGGAPNPRIHISAPANEPTPLSEADKRDEVHTSNEFMLVLFHKNSKVKDKEKQDSFDLDLEEALQPPPISISSPDLASLEFSNLHTFPLRRSVSSTELLYERAMARFYEAVEMEEAEKARKLKVSQEKLPGQPLTVRKRLGSMSEAERLSFEKRSLRRRSTDIGDLVSSSNPKWDSKDNVSRPLSRTRNLMDDSFRQESQETDEISDYQGKPGDSFDVESDYTASTDSVSEDSIEKFKRELVARTRSTSDELETYHPRSMTGGVFTPYRAPTPEQSVIVLNRPMPLASPDFVPKPILKRPSKENVLRDGSLSPTNGASSPTSPGSPAVPSSPTAPSSPTLPIEPIFPTASPSPEPAPQHSSPPRSPISPSSPPRSPISPSSPPRSPMSPSSPPRFPNSPSSPPPLPTPPAEKPEKSKGFKSFFKWDKKPAEKPAEPEPQMTKAAAEAEFKRRAKEEEDRKKREAERIFEEEAKVVVDHYSDLVRQVGTTKKYNPPLYLNREELKKAAERAAQEGLHDDDIDDFHPGSEHYDRLHKPRLSLVERQQIQHVKDTASRLAMTVTEKSKIPETPSEEDATPSSASQPSQRSSSRGRTKIVKIKKIVKKRVPSGTRSRDQSSSRPPSSLGASSEDFARRQASRTRFAPEAVPKRELPPPQPPQQPQPPPSTALVAVPQKSAQELTQEAEEKVRSAVSYMTDVCLFIAACYVYLFKDARLVLPILALMVYRQLGEVIRNIIPDWMRRKRQ